MFKVERRKNKHTLKTVAWPLTGDASVANEAKYIEKHKLISKSHVYEFGKACGIKGNARFNWIFDICPRLLFLCDWLRVRRTPLAVVRKETERTEQIKPGNNHSHRIYSWQRVPTKIATVDTISLPLGGLSHVRMALARWVSLSSGGRRNLSQCFIAAK